MFKIPVQQNFSVFVFKIGLSDSVLVGHGDQAQCYFSQWRLTGQRLEEGDGVHDGRSSLELLLCPWKLDLWKTGSKQETLHSLIPKHCKQLCCRVMSSFRLACYIRQKQVRETITNHLKFHTLSLLFPPTPWPLQLIEQCGLFVYFFDDFLNRPTGINKVSFIWIELYGERPPGGARAAPDRQVKRRGRRAHHG